MLQSLEVARVCVVTVAKLRSLQALQALLSLQALRTLLSLLSLRSLFFVIGQGTYNPGGLLWPDQINSVQIISLAGAAWVLPRGVGECIDAWPSPRARRHAGLACVRLAGPRLGRAGAIVPCRVLKIAFFCHLSPKSPA